MKTYPLNPSPVAVMRVRYRLDQVEAARRLGLSLGQLKVLEMRTGEVPPDILEVIDLLLGPPTCYRQTTIWEALEELGRLEAQNDGGESPVAVLRRRYGLSPDKAASQLGISVLRLARLEAATRRLPVGTLAAIAERFGPPGQPLTIMDHVRAIVAAGEHAPTVGEGRCDG